MRGLCFLFIFFFYTGEAEAPLIKEIPIFIVEKPEEIGEFSHSSTFKANNNLSLLHPYFRNKVLKLLYECKKRNIDLYVVETYRTEERQNILRERGFSQLKGGKSKHQYNIAVDVVPIVNNTYVWDNVELWEEIGKIGESLGLFWGGRWKKFRDYPHFELPISIKEVENLTIPDTVYIPLNYNL